jgi:DNA-binding SARP family transcriptional activator
MIGFRPKPSALFLERPRLLRLLPEEPGYVVWLEAPYGYGKSVLVSQWMTRLEEDGWRVVWLGLVEGDPRPGLALALGLPDSAPWRSVLESLSVERTAVVLEDLDGAQGLGPLLKFGHGLVLLASRRGLRDPELPRLRTEGRLVHVTAQQLAFTPDEAARLFDDQKDAKRAWEQTRGWSLPLHMAALTGEVTGEHALWDGIRESLEPAEWQTLLVLSCLEFAPLDVLPLAARLSQLGFIQALEGGYRAHPLIADRLIEAYPTEAENAVLVGADRLSPLLRGQALARLGLDGDLAALLETDSFDFARFDPERVLRWDAILPLPRGLIRAQQVGKSLCRVGKVKDGVALLLETARHPQISPDGLLSVYKDAVFFLAQHQQPDQARQLEAEGMRWLDSASPEMAGRFLNNGQMIYFTRGDWARAEALLTRALSYYPEASRWRAVSLGNLAITRWHAHGDLEGLLSARAAMLKENRTLNPSNVPGDGLQLAELQALLGQREAALGHLAQVEPFVHANPRWGLEAEALRLHLIGDPARFADLHARVSAWGDEHLIARVRFFWARTLRLRGEGSLEVVPDDTAWERIERALALGSLEALGPILGAHEPMELRLYDAAARYQLGREASELERLIGLTLVRERVLPALVPLNTLPRSRPDLARAYPLAVVLSSGWKDAVQLRQAEIPPLELRVLGGFEVRLLGQAVNLTARPKDILMLLALRLPRDQIAEALWSDADTDKSRNNLHVNLNALRKVLEPWGVPTYILESGLARAKVDLWDLEAALKSGDFGAVRGLYADLAPGFDLLVLEEYRDELRQRTLEAVLDHALKSTNPTEAEDALEWLLARDPVHEEAFSSLLRLLVRSGRRVSAERRYRAFAERLRDEMGLEPALEIRRILDVA